MATSDGQQSDSIDELRRLEILNDGTIARVTGVCVICRRAPLFRSDAERADFECFGLCRECIERDVAVKDDGKNG